MVEIFRHLSVCFTAGVFGGLVNSLFVWGMGALGVFALLRVDIAPAWTLPWVYQRLVWGGIWGLLFMVPVLSRSVWGRGALLGLLPSLVQLLVVFPNVVGKGMLGLDLGTLTPVVVLVANTIWGAAAAFWMMCSQEQPRRRGRL
ncbi:MAG: hypothetical protein ACLGSA_06680 [Acidobacteriota bacterium]